MSASNPATPPSGQRPCPYCGTWNVMEFSFCRKCGRPLPLSEPLASHDIPAPLAPMGAAPSASTAFGPPSVPGAAPPDSPVVERPLTEGEVDLIRRAQKTGVIPLLRMLGVLTGIMPLSLIAAAAMGAPMVADMYIPLVMVTGFLGVGFGGASMGRRTQIARVLAHGSAREVYGIPEMATPKVGFVAVGIAGLSLRLKAAQTKRLLPDRLNKIVYVDGGTTGGPKSKAGWSVALALEWNGTAVPKLETFFVKAGPAAVGS